MDLLAVSGFDTGTGKCTEQQWRAYVTQMQEWLAITLDKTVCEIGCGGGAFLYVLYEQGVQVSGIDYSDTSIAVAKRVMPEMDFHVGEASQPGYSNVQFDVVLSSSVFQYFPDLNYAKHVLEEIHRITKSGGIIGVFDVPDLEKQKASEILRRGALSLGEYERMYVNHQHLYYDKQWFRDIAKQLNCSIEIRDQNIHGYKNSTYRYNLKICKD